ncbi:MAG: CynX/NimT family MFS transporter [Dehalococcoidia bacterium]
MIQHNSYRFTIYALVLFAHLVAAVNFIGPSPVLPIVVEELGVSSSYAGLYVSSMTLTVTIASIPMSILTNRFGLNKFYIAGWAILGVGVITVFVEQFELLVLVRTVQGLGAAIILPTSAAVIMQWAPEKEIPIINTVNLSAFTAAMGVGLILGAPVAEWLGWKMLLSFEGALGILGAVFWLLFYRSNTEQGLKEESEQDILQQISVVFKDKTTWLLSAAVIGPWAQFIALSTWLPTYYLTERSFDLAMAGFTTSIFTFAGLPATLLGGFLIARLGKRRPILMFAGGLLGITAFGAVASTTLPFIYLFVFLTGFLQWVYEPAIFTVPMELKDSTPEKASAIWACMLTAGNASSFVAPVIVGLLFDITDNYLPGFILIFAISSSLFFASILLPETGTGAGSNDLIITDK